MRPHRYLLLLALVGLADCLTDFGQKLPDPEPVGALSIKNVSISNRSISFLVTYGVGSTGWVFSHTEQGRSGHSFFLRGFARPPEGGHLPVVTTIDGPINVTVEEPGLYSFQFWRYEGSTLDTSLTVP